MIEQPLSRKSKILFSMLSGLLLGISFPPVPTGVSAFVGFIPFLFVMESANGAWRAFKYAYLTFLVFNLTTIYWISGFGGDDIWLMISGFVVNLFHPILFCIPATIYYLIRKKFGSLQGLIAFQFIWVTYEWLAQLPDLSFPWLMLANSQTYNFRSLQFISITGALGASFWIVVVNIVGFIILKKYLTRKENPHQLKHLVVGIVVLFLLIFLPILYSGFVLDSTASKRSVKVGIAQPDVDPYDKWGEGDTPKDKVANLLELYDSLSLQKVDLVLLPETSIPFRILLYTYVEELAALQRHIDSVGVPLLTGFPDTKFYNEGEAPVSAKRFTNSPIRFDDFNAALLILPQSASRQIYHKIKLTPMSERIPMLDTFPFLSEWLTWGVGISGWGKGKDTTIFLLPQQPKTSDTTKFWTMICYETLYPEFISRFVDRGAEFLGVITNDGWFGKTSGPHQLKQYAVLRAIENRRAIARCANNGVSCFIDPYGRVTHETELYTRTSIVGNVPLIEEKTFYTKHGDWFAQGCSLITGLFFLRFIFSRRKKDATH